MDEGRGDTSLAAGSSRTFLSRTVCKRCAIPWILITQEPYQRNIHSFQGIPATLMKISQPHWQNTTGDESIKIS
jgi:hypothetical protein